MLVRIQPKQLNATTYLALGSGLVSRHARDILGLVRTEPDEASHGVQLTSLVLVTIMG